MLVTLYEKFDAVIITSFTVALVIAVGVGMGAGVDDCVRTNNPPIMTRRIIIPIVTLFFILLAYHSAEEV